MSFATALLNSWVNGHGQTKSISLTLPKTQGFGMTNAGGIQDLNKALRDPSRNGRGRQDKRFDHPLGKPLDYAPRHGRGGGASPAPTGKRKSEIEERAACSGGLAPARKKQIEVTRRTLRDGDFRA